MKIAHIVSTYPPYYGGMGNVVFQTASELVKLGHNVEVFTPQYYGKEEIKSKEDAPEKTHSPDIEERIDYARRLKPSFEYGNAAFLPGLGRELDTFDIVHLHYPFFGVANTVRLWKLRHKDRPLIITYHMDTRASGWKGALFALYARFWMPKILAAGDKLIASSFDYIDKSDAGEFFRANPDKWVELPFGVDIERFYPGGKDAKLFELHGLNKDGLTILFVGGMDSAHYFKGVPVLINSLSILKQQGLEVQAILVGDGNLRESFELQCNALGLSQSVRFAGAVSDEDIPRYYRLADLFVLPSVTCNEAFGMVILEAFASGVPVVATDIPGVRAVAGEGGTVVMPNNASALSLAIAEYLTNYTALKSIGANVRKLAEEKYSWTPIVKKLEQIYLSLAR